MTITTPTGRPAKHGRSTYKRYGCRCDVCVSAKRLEAQRWEVSARGKQVAQRKHLRLKYGLTPEMVEAMVLAQGGVCALCGRQSTKEALLVDHDHETGRVRGMLCRGCNVQLGKWGDNEAGLRRVLDYVIGPHE